MLGQWKSQPICIVSEDSTPDSSRVKIECIHSEMLHYMDIIQCNCCGKQKKKRVLAPAMSKHSEERKAIPTSENKYCFDL